MPTVSKNPKQDKRKELRETIDANIDALAKAVDEVRASEAFRAYLDTQARFHKYSWCNCLLIASQRPSATQVAGYKTWQKLKRQVRKGETGIKIFAPCKFSREVDKGNGETETKDGMFFRCVSVFDVSQTDGPDLPSVDVPTVDVAADTLLHDLCSVATSRSITVSFQPIDGGAFGASKKGAIDIDDTHETGQQAKTLAHELAHEALHWEDRGSFTRSIAELEAESVAYVVCRHFNLDVEVRASRYIALWDGNGKALRASLERIATTAKGIITDVEAVRGRKVVAA